MANNARHLRGTTRRLEANDCTATFRLPQIGYPYAIHKRHDPYLFLNSRKIQTETGQSSWNHHWSTFTNEAQNIQGLLVTMKKLHISRLQEM